MDKRKGIIFFLIIIIFLPLTKLLNFKSVLAGTDIVSYFFYLFDFFRQSILTGQFPFWNPYLFSGYPFLSAIQTGLLYPFNYLVLIINTEFGINLSLIFHFIIGFYGSLLLASLFISKKILAIIPAVIFIFNGYVATRLFYGHITILYVYFWQPVIMYLLLKYLYVFNKKYIILLSVLTGLVFYAGHPQIFYYLLFALTLVVLFNILNIFKNKKKLLYLFLSLLIIIFLILPQLMPAVEFTFNSSRYQDRDYAFNTYFSLHPTHIIQIIAPNYLGNSIDNNYWRSIWRQVTGFEEYNLFIGFISLFFVLIAFVKANDKKILPFKLLFLLSFFIALGKYTPFYKLFYYFVPGFNIFRWPVRILSVFQLSNIVLTASGINYFFSGNKIKKFNTKIIMYMSYGIILVSLLFIFTYYLSDLIADNLSFNIQFEVYNAIRTFSYTSGFALLKLSCIILLFIIIIKSDLKDFSKYILIILLTFFELISFTGKFIRTTDMKKYENEIHTFLKDNIDKTERVLSISKIEHIAHYASLHISNIKGYDPLIYNRYSDYMSFLELEKGLSPNIRFYLPDYNHKLFRFLNVKYIIDYDEKISDKLHLRKFKDTFIYENENRYGFIKLYSKYIVNNKEEFFNIDFNLLDTYLFVEDENVLKDYKFEDNPELKNFSIKTFNNNNIVFHAEIDKDALVLTSIVNYPGWKVFVNNKKVDSFYGNYIFVSFPLQKGYNEIVLKYSPTNFKLYVVTLFFSLVVCIFLIYIKK